MAKKLNKPRNILLFQNLYPINLYISDIDNWDEITQFFDFFLTTKHLQNEDKCETPDKPNNALGVTYLVAEKKSGIMGILIVLKSKVECSTLAHESIHYADAVYDFLRMNTEGYDEGNEQYAYLVTWCVDQLEEYLRWKERKMTEKTIRQDGN